MIRLIITAAALFSATSTVAQDITIDGAFIPLAPPGVKSHAAYLSLSNTSEQTRSLIGVTAEGYRMAHLHQSTEHDGIAAMSMVHQLDIAPGQTIFMAPGSFHIMLMHPQSKMAAGEAVSIVLHFANGENITAEATITPRRSNS